MVDTKHTAALHSSSLQPAAIALHDMQISLCIVNNVEVDDDKSLFGESFCNGKVHCNAAV